MQSLVGGHAIVEVANGLHALVVARVVHRIGNYALSFEWSDGHSTGIYAFDSLRALCECSACRKS